MNKNKSYTLILGFLIFILAFIVFTIFDNGFHFERSLKIIPPLLFSLSCPIIIFIRRSRKFFLYISVLLLMGMVILFIFDQIDLANFVGSLGFGELILVFVSYLPALFKDGYIQKF